MKRLDLFRYSLQESLEYEENGDGTVAEEKGRESDGGQGAQEHMQRVDTHPVIASDSTSPDHNSPTSTMSPASSFQTDSGYGITSPTGSADLWSLPATPPREEISPGSKRR